jgi:hypothetical protein
MSGWWAVPSSKSEFLRRLRERVGHPGPGTRAAPFDFAGGFFHWDNLAQLEAVVEFYANWTDPWAGAAPIAQGNANYFPIDFRDPSGKEATVAGNVVTLHDVPAPDLRRVTPVVGNNPRPNANAPKRFLYDTIWLKGDTTRASRLYRIRDVNNAAHTVTIDRDRPTSAGTDTPVLAEPRSAWRINLRPILVLIDSFGARTVDGVTLEGDAATVAGPVPNPGGGDPDTRLSLDGNPDLSRVNATFDTIYLADDTIRGARRPWRTYRIIAVDDANNTVTVRGAPAPVLANGSSTWHIPAGLSGEMPDTHYDFGPGGALGRDHLDGVLFIVHGGKVKERFRWSSYTSRGNAQPHHLSSVRGNRRLFYRSYRSGRSQGAGQVYLACDGTNQQRPFRNYSFKVEDLAPVAAAGAPQNTGIRTSATDSVSEGRFYFATPVTADANGKQLIRLHHSRDESVAGCSSAGCVVSHVYEDMRSALVDIYNEEHKAFNGVGDAEVDKLDGLDHQESMDLYEACIDGGLTDVNWIDKLVGTLWIIRPDERPLG